MWPHEIDLLYRSYSSFVALLIFFLLLRFPIWVKRTEEFSVLSLGRFLFTWSAAAAMLSLIGSYALQKLAGRLGPFPTWVQLATFYAYYGVFVVGLGVRLFQGIVFLVRALGSLLTERVLWLRLSKLRRKLKSGGWYAKQHACES